MKDKEFAHQQLANSPMAITPASTPEQRVSVFDRWRSMFPAKKR